MAKKQKIWFSHDANAWDDPKIVALVTQYEMPGYGRWWRLLEILRTQEGYRYDISPKFAYAALAKHLMCTLSDVKEFINNCIEEFTLIQTDGTYIWSESLIERMEPMDKKREKLSENGKKGAATTNIIKSAKSRQLPYNNSAIDENITAIADQKVDKLNNIRVNNTKGDNSSQNIVELVGDKKSPTPSKEEMSEKKEKIISEKQAAFYNTLVPFANKYDKKMLREFYEYWSEPNKSRTKIKWELRETWDVALRLSTWAAKDNNFGSPTINNEQQKFTKSI